MSRKRVPLNQNECTADFRIGVPFEQNLQIGAAYEKISEEYSDILVAGKVNIDEEPQIAEAEKIEVIPTLVLYRNGKAIDSIVAPESKIMIENFINEALEK